MLREPTLEKLHAMRLRVLADTWLEQDKSPDTLAMTFDERLALLVDAEMLARENARLTKNLRDAKLRIAEACVEGIDFPRERLLDKAVVRQLATCRWIAEHQTVTRDTRRTRCARSLARRWPSAAASAPSSRASSGSSGRRCRGSRLEARRFQPRSSPRFMKSYSNG